ncbi:MAG: hypothetical protein OEW19_17060 [Acidobacteriota bacterium]|nr:hypothetical protein [Acidobacteriota bacterium]
MRHDAENPALVAADAFQLGGVFLGDLVQAGVLDHEGVQSIGGLAGELLGADLEASVACPEIERVFVEAEQLALGAGDVVDESGERASEERVVRALLQLVVGLDAVELVEYEFETRSTVFEVEALEEPVVAEQGENASYLVRLADIGRVVAAVCQIAGQLSANGLRIVPWAKTLYFDNVMPKE